ncbi:hypothetical protein P7H00_01870 [Enterococcus pseudoavium]|uniref:Uncharacterized protein n=1 Tax=Enterococcus pseudoavium TaxID=44007 RepID=A0AAE4HXL7_9ENTE|nr:hypothetical protein [Enterococcus pseudoavium]MDT2735880.1 hypothetical protein [Enterococcus pseudoavium]
MTEAWFTPRQLFCLKRKTLEKRLTDYYQASQDEDLTIRYLVALQIRDKLGQEDFSKMLPDLVRQIFLTCPLSKTLRRYFRDFKAYFSKKDWRKFLLRLASSAGQRVKGLVAVGRKLTKHPVKLPKFRFWLKKSMNDRRPLIAAIHCLKIAKAPPLRLC